MSTAGRSYTYSSVLDPDGHYNNRQKRLHWNSTLNRLEHIICTLRELIDVRVGYKECNCLSNSEAHEFVYSCLTLFNLF